MITYLSLAEGLYLLFFDGYPVISSAVLTKNNDFSPANPNSTRLYW